ncbi:hypothetical protein AB0D99_10405 [Streptomyces sp. NPDC047971]|uniref:hypothetical protein n=1 Tax=Streptomyces sp. NPDC047971 TaxID=3154499 RepID=UPI0033F5A52B
MTDEGTAAQQHAERPAVRIEFVPAELLPEGHRVVGLTAPGSFVWGVREGEMSDELRTEMNQCLEHVIGSGLWQQHWADDETPPTHPH